MMTVKFKESTWTVSVVTVRDKVSRAAVVVQATDWRHFVMMYEDELDWQTAAAAVVYVVEREFRSSRPSQIIASCPEFVDALDARDELEFVRIRCVDGPLHSNAGEAFSKHVLRAA